jgi:hypothetical protein
MTWSGEAPPPVDTPHHANALQPGQKVKLIDGSSTRSAQIVNVAQGSQGIECLAVTSFGSATPEPAGSTNETPTLTVIALPMSYALPE